MHRNAAIFSAVYALASITSGCFARARIEQQCVFDSDCDDALVCAGGFCRAVCRTDRDCIPSGGACVPGPEPDSTLCLWPSSPPLCNYNTDCKRSRICSPDGWCSPQCTTDADCMVVHRNGRCRASGCYLINFGETCGPSLSACDGRCVDLAQDPAHCGECGVSCDGDKRCVSGVCRASCLAPTTECGLQCVDTQSNPAHCGACGRECGDNAICREGSCVPLCTSGELCAGACVDTQTSALHCGACDRRCPAGLSCVRGQCMASLMRAQPLRFFAQNYVALRAQPVSYSRSRSDHRWVVAGTLRTLVNFERSVARS